MFQKVSLANSRRITNKIFCIRIFHNNVPLLWQWAVYTTRWPPQKVEPWITFKFSGCSLGGPTKRWRGRGSAPRRVTNVPTLFGGTRPASITHHPPALPPPVSSDAAAAAAAAARGRARRQPAVKGALLEGAGGSRLAATQRGGMRVAGPDHQQNGFFLSFPFLRPWCEECLCRTLMASWLVPLVFYDTEEAASKAEKSKWREPLPLTHKDRHTFIVLTAPLNTWLRDSVRTAFSLALSIQVTRHIWSDRLCFIYCHMNLYSSDATDQAILLLFQSIVELCCNRSAFYFPRARR